MKNKNFVILILALFTICILNSCNSSVKGKWSEAEKNKLRTNLNNNEAISEDVGQMKDKFIDCYILKIEKKYDSMDEMENDANGNYDIYKECQKEVGY